MERIFIKNKLNNYDVLLGYNSFHEFLLMFNFPKKVMVITTKDLYNPLSDILKDKKFDYFFIDSNESSKNINNYLEITKALTEKEYNKSDLVLSIGGGVVSDLAGFVSSTYKRGINLIIVPTTLLSMVDAAIGGKNGVNYLGIKNVLGSIYPPNMVIISYEFLNTLSDKEFNSGLMEILKAGIIGDKELVDIIRDNNTNQIRDNIFLLSEIIKKSINVKKEVVEIDPFEEDYRRILNLGHTIGHAIEALNSPNITHGEAIALGMIPFLNESIRDDITKIIKKFINKKELDLNKDKLIKLVLEDKKIRDDKLNIVYANDICDVEIKEINLNDLEEKLDEINIWK